MGVHVLYDPDQEKSVMFDPVSETAFGPLFDGRDEIEAFLVWCQESDSDPRMLTDRQLSRAIYDFRETVEEPDSAVLDYWLTGKNKPVDPGPVRTIMDGWVS